MSKGAGKFVFVFAIAIVLALSMSIFVSASGIGDWFNKIIGKDVKESPLVIPGPLGNPLNSAPDWNLVGSADFNSDGYNDLLWRNSVSGQVGIWYLEGNLRNSVKLVANAAGTPLATSVSSWNLKGVGDFNSDGKPDLLWRSISDGSVALWYMNDNVQTSSILVKNDSAASGIVLKPNADWGIIGAGNFDANNNADILWRNSADNRMSIWFMEGNIDKQGLIVKDTAGNTKYAPADWNLIGSADFDGDNLGDLIWRHKTTGAVAYWYMNKNVQKSAVTVATTTTVSTWDLIGASDINRDGKNDLIWEHKNDGSVAIWLMDNAQKINVTFIYNKPSPLCTDSDGGVMPFEFGNATSRVNNVVLNDACFNGSILNEAKCLADGVASYGIGVTCQNGCLAGKCNAPTIPTPTCIDHDLGADAYFIKSNATGIGSSGSLSVINDGCIISEGPNNGWLREGTCADGVPNWVDYNCSNGCLNGACNRALGFGTYTILEDYISFNGGNVVELDGNITFGYGIIVNSSDKDNVPNVVQRNIITPSNGIISVSLNKRTDWGHCDDNVGNCYITFDGGYLRVSELGKYSFNLTTPGPNIIAYGVERGFVANHLILEQKYLPGNPAAWYSNYDDSIDLNMEYGFYERESVVDEGGIQIKLFNSVQAAQRYLDEILNDVTGGENLRINTVNINGNSVYLLSGELNEGTRGVIKVLAAVWTSNDGVVLYVDGLTLAGDAQSDISQDEFIKALQGEQVKFKANAQLEDFHPLSQELVMKYLARHPSSVVSGSGSCIPNWQCTVAPLVCPEYAEQTKTCTDLSGCKQATQAQTRCTPGICSGCLNDGKCVPYGTRLGDIQGKERVDVDEVTEGVDYDSTGKVELNLTIYDEKSAHLYFNDSGQVFDQDIYVGGTYDITVDNTINTFTVTRIVPAVGDQKGFIEATFRARDIFDGYCDIDGKLKKQKVLDLITGNAAKCQNNYECNSNLCSGGECIEIGAAIKEARGLKGLLVKGLCRLSNLFDDSEYDKCIVKYLS